MSWELLRDACLPVALILVAAAAASLIRAERQAVDENTSEES